MDIDDQLIYVFFVDGIKMLLFFIVLDCDNIFRFCLCLVVYYQDLYFVFYGNVYYIKVFNKEGQFLYDIGREGFGEGQLSCFIGLVIDNFNNFIVFDNG